jgi:CRISPR type I-E-associated protein CasB/Cse2
MTEPNEFIRYLEQLRDRDDRAALASLRRGLGAAPGAATEANRIIQRGLTADTKDYLEIACSIVAPLFALHSQAGGEGNMGQHFRALCEPIQPGEALPSNVERRFMALLSSDAEELPDTLRQAVALLKSKEVAVNWRQLLRDVMGWTHEDGYVRKQWGRAFWRAPQTTHSNASQVKTTED